MLIRVVIVVTFHDLGILNPSKLMSSVANLNDPCDGGINLIDS